MSSIDQGTGILKTVMGATDLLRFEDIIIQAESEKNLLDNCVCGEQLTNIIATQPHETVPEGVKRLAVIKCYECDRAYYTRINED